MTSIHDNDITIGLTGLDWEPTDETRFYSQRGSVFSFGSTELEALSNLLVLESERAQALSNLNRWLGE